MLTEERINRFFCLFKLGCFDKLRELMIYCCFRYWCLKEACVKAMGSGMAYGLDKLEFHHKKWQDISVKIDGEIMQEWRFWILVLGKGHLVSQISNILVIFPFLSLLPISYTPNEWIDFICSNVMVTALAWCSF